MTLSGAETREIPSPLTSMKIESTFYEYDGKVNGKIKWNCFREKRILHVREYLRQTFPAFIFLARSAFAVRAPGYKHKSLFHCLH